MKFKPKRFSEMEREVPELPEPLYLDTVGYKVASGGMAGKHKQQANKTLMTCVSCGKGHCENCVDRLRLLHRDDPICECRRRDHLDKMQGEARLKQVQDPFTDSVHGTGLAVTSEGEVRRDGV